MHQITPEQFWSECAKNLVWFKQWDKVLDWNPSFCKMVSRWKNKCGL